MRKPLITFCRIFILAFMFMSTSAKAENPILGSWIFNVTQAPWEYSRGKVVFELAEDKEMKGRIVFDSGIEVKIVTIAQESEKITFEVNVEGMPVKTIVTLKDDNLSGYVETYEGNMPFTAKRHVPEE